MTIVAVDPPELPASTLISHGVVIRELGLVFVSGQLSWNAERQLIGKGDLSVQFRTASANVDAVLRAAGTSRAHLVKETIYVVGYCPDLTPEVLRLVQETRRAGRVAPASTIVGVDSLVGADFLVEIEAVATLPTVEEGPDTSSRGPDIGGWVARV
ncbi:hypothetical protein BAY59_27130 [Prauserella coralliicola]|nr:hypothetical protein BAY59_27130 [Prauserella coralliicola]